MIKKKGSALIFTLAILSLLLIIAMVFAFNSTTTQQATSMHVDVTKSRLWCQSGVNRALAVITYEASQVTANHTSLNPGILFLPSTNAISGGWNNASTTFARARYLPSVSDSSLYGNHVFDAGIDSGLNSRLLAYGSQVLDFTANGSVHVKVGWQAMMTKVDASDGAGTTMTDSIIGRFCYVVVDQTGKIDPTLLVSSTVSEGAETRIGASLDELNLGNVVGNATKYQPNDNSGDMPKGVGWLSYQMMYRGLSTIGTQKDTVVNHLFPYTVSDPEQFASDTNLIGSTADSALIIFDRIDLSALAPIGTVAVQDVYDLLIGYDATNNPNRNSNGYWSPWLKEVHRKTPLTTKTARAVAAQMAINMRDWIDEDNDDSDHPEIGYIQQTNGYLDMNSNVTGGEQAANNAEITTRVNALGDDYETIIHGIEYGCGLSELYIHFHLEDNGTDVDVTPNFQFEVVNPFDNNAFQFELDIEYEYVVSDSGGGNTTKTDSVSFTESDADQNDTIDGGKRYYTDTDHGDGTQGLAHADFRLDSLKIKSIEMKFNGRTMRKYPLSYHGTPLTLNSYFMKWDNTSGTPMAQDSNTKDYYVKLIKKDVMFSDRDGKDSDFTTYWDVFPGTATEGKHMSDAIGTSDPSTSIGDGNDIFYQGASYCDSWIPDNSARTNFTRVGQLGQLHSPHTQNQSVRFWAKTDAEITGHDGYLLDMFKIGTAKSIRGRLNINSHNSGTLKTLFSDVSGMSWSLGRSSLFQVNGTTGGIPFLYRGDVVKMFPVYDTLSSLDQTDDAKVEEWIEKFIEFTGTRQNYYSIIVTAQTLKNTGGLNTGNDNSVQWRKAPGNWALITSEQKVMATVFRDAWLNKTKIIRYDFLEE